MEKRRKTPADINQLAKMICDVSTGDTKPMEPVKEKNPAAVALGRLGGLKGGKARAEKLSPEERKVIARKAAQTRWERK
jgi:hypothetical protein